MIFRKVNFGYRNTSEWIKSIARDLFTEETMVHMLGLDQFIKEIFDLLDYNGDAYLDDDELYGIEQSVSFSC